MNRPPLACTGWLVAAFLSIGLLLDGSPPTFLQSAAAAAEPAAAPSPHATNTQRPGEEPPSAIDLLRGFRLPGGFRAVLFAAEPDVSQPIAIATDDRGRLWVVENYSYPEWRTVGTDRVLIFEDADGDGRFDSRKVFLDGGRNLTGIEIGHGGIWLTSPPELVFVPDRDRDDVPDGPPEPILDGFEAQRVAHNVVNGLRWGPDGWLYGRHGIQAMSRVGRPGTPAAARIPVDCCIWRVHPGSRRFEVVARGTTNPWGLDYDDLGEMVFTNNVIGHLWHLVPGAHYERMRGVDPEPHVYELMPQCADHLHWPGGEWQASRETDGRQDPAVAALGGGHSHCGGMIYLGDMFPAACRGRMFMCNTHGKRVNVDRIEHGPRGVVGRHEADFLEAFDTWFRGIELLCGPDGRVWIADWTDKGECHDHDGVHRTSGRIYTVLHGGRPAGRPAQLPPAGLRTADDAALVALQLHSNDWFCRQARLILAERKAAGRDCTAAAASLRELAAMHADPTRRLRGLWGARAVGAADPGWLRERLADPHPSLRAWAVRLLLDDLPAEKPAVGEGTPEWLAATLADLASREPAGLVRLHLAGGLGRLPPADRWEIAEPLAARPEDADWRSLALVLWYGLRDPVAADPARAAALAASTPMPALRRLIARRLAFDADRSAARAAAVAAILEPAEGTAAAADPARRADLLEGIAAAWKGRRRVVLPEAVATVVDRAVAAAVGRAGGAAGDSTANSAADAFDRAAAAAKSIAAVRGGGSASVVPPSAEAAAVEERMRTLQAAGRLSQDERRAAIDRWRATLTPEFLARADLVAGRGVWRQRCAVCHMLFGEGGGLGPDLTGSGRAEADYLIINVIHPNASVPDAWRLTQVVMGDGRVLSGAVAASDERTLTLRTLSGEIVIDREELEEIVVQKQSAMPEGLWNDLGDEEVRDLVAYLASPAPPADPGR